MAFGNSLDLITDFVCFCAVTDHFVHILYISATRFCILEYNTEIQTVIDKSYRGGFPFRCSPLLHHDCWESHGAMVLWVIVLHLIYGPSGENVVTLYFDGPF